MPASASGPPWVAVTFLLAIVLVIHAGDALTIPFINDDFIFLDKTRAASFASLWAPRDLAFHWYRPWSRELHYWTLQHLFGTFEPAFHTVSMMLWLAVGTLFFTLVRRLAGVLAASIATAGFVSLAAWGVPLLWVAGVQDLWMLTFALLTLHALARGRPGLATAACALALLSKETAAVLPAVAWAGEVTLGRRTPVRALRRTAPLWGLVIVWALLHPALGGRLWNPLPSTEPAPRPAAASVVSRTALMPLNLDEWPRPERGWGNALARGALGTLPLLVLIGWAWRGLRPHDRPTGESAAAPSAAWPEATGRRVALFGAAWALCGWVPLLAPSLGWHAYYALLGAGGVWLALGVTMARRPLVAAVLIVTVALLRPARADCPSRDWGSEWYQRRAAEFLRHMRTDLMRQRPELPPHSRLYFVMVPSNVGFLAGDGPALRVWYGDPTLSGGYYPSYTPRGPGARSGEDLFFRFDSLSGWVPVVTGPEDPEAAQRDNPRWLRDHVVLAERFAQAGDWPRAAAEYAKLAQALPARVDHAFNAGVSFEHHADSAAAALWYARADRRAKGADSDAREAAIRFERHLREVP